MQYSLTHIWASTLLHLFINAGECELFVKRKKAAIYHYLIGLHPCSLQYRTWDELLINPKWILTTRGITSPIFLGGVSEILQIPFSNMNKNIPRKFFPAHIIFFLLYRRFQYTYHFRYKFDFSEVLLKYFIFVPSYPIHVLPTGVRQFADQLTSGGLPSSYSPADNP